MRYRALLVDDEPSILRTLRAILENHKFQVETAPTAVAARKSLDGGSFDLVITDMSMETEDAGYRVVYAARNQPNPPATLILTAFPTLAADWEAQGADAIVIKPTPIPELLAVIDGLVRRHLKRAA